MTQPTLQTSARTEAEPIGREDPGPGARRTSAAAILGGIAGGAGGAIGAAAIVAMLSVGSDPSGVAPAAGIGGSLGAGIGAAIGLILTWFGRSSRQDTPASRTAAT